MLIGLLTLDDSGIIVSCNTAAARILGYGAGELHGNSSKEIFPDLTDALDASTSGCRHDQPDTQLTTNAWQKDGRDLQLVVTPHVIPDQGGPSARHWILLLFQDATELQKLDDQLQHMDRLHSLDQFAAGIVHEIRNPLASISTNAQHMIEQIGPSDPFHEEMRDILAAAEDIEDIVRKVLDFSRPSVSEVGEASVNDLVEDVLRLSKMPLRRQGIQLVSDLSESAARVRVDVSQMKQVLFHIVRNAYEAMPEGGELRVSTAQPQDSNGQVRVEVADTGQGILTEHLERIFDPFFSTHREGTGLGLAVARKIVESHGGRIDVQSEKGKGTTFGIVLPSV